MKRKGIYYFMYSSGSCHDHTYRVQYATSDKPMGGRTPIGDVFLKPMPMEQFMGRDIIAF